MSTWAIGDLQGCHDAFIALLKKIRFNPDRDQLWLTGDLVNRGGQSLEVLRNIFQMKDNCICVLGNHDLNMLAQSQMKPEQRKSNAEMDAVFEADDSVTLLNWLASRPLLHKDDELGFIMVHAGLPPGVRLEEIDNSLKALEACLAGPDAGEFFRNMYGNEPDHWTHGLSQWPQYRFLTNAFTRMRYVSSDGHLLLDYKGPPSSAPKGYIPWFLHPECINPGYRVIFGHWSTLGLLTGPQWFCLDSGCVWGGSMVAMNLDDPENRASIQC